MSGVKVITKGEINHILVTLESIKGFISDVDVEIPEWLEEQMQDSWELLFALWEAPDEPIPDTDYDSHSGGDSYV